MIRRPPRSTPFPTRRSSDLVKNMISQFTKHNISNGIEQCVKQIGETLKEKFPFIPKEDKNELPDEDRKSTRLNSSHSQISYAVFCLKKKKKKNKITKNKIS